MRVKIAQEQLGLASISTTVNIYTHVGDASHRQGIEDVEERLFGFWPEMARSWRQGSKALRL